METNSRDNANFCLKRRQRICETAASMGLVLVAVGLVAPFAGLLTAGWLTAFKWIYSSGAAIYLAARFAGSLGRGESVRVRRLRRMECWAGVALAVGAFFWFYNTRGFEGMPTFHMLNDTILFTMAGALIQLIASWRLATVLKQEKEQGQETDSRQ